MVEHNGNNSQERLFLPAVMMVVLAGIVAAVVWKLGLEPRQIGEAMEEGFRLGNSI